MYVYEEDGRIAGLVRVERESVRDEWTIVELDAVGMADAGDIRYRLVQQLLREGAKRGGGSLPRRVRRHRRQRRAVHAGRLHPLRRGADPVPAGGSPLPRAVVRRARGQARIRPTTGQDALALSRLYADSDAAPRSAGSKAFRLADWERQGTHWRVPRSSLAPILRFADVEALRPGVARRRQGRDAARRLPPGRRRQGGPAALPQDRRPARRRRRRPRRLRSWRHRRADDARSGDHRHDHGVIAPVRTYESPVDRRLEDAGFDSIANVNLLMKETLVRVAEPALVPAGVR